MQNLRLRVDSRLFKAFPGTTPEVAAVVRDRSPGLVQLLLDVVWKMRADAAAGRRTHLQALIIYKLGFNQNYHTFTLVLLMKIDLCSKLP